MKTPTFYLLLLMVFIMIQFQKENARFVHKQKEPKGGLTIGYVRRPEGVLVGIARCHKNDKYNRRLGGDLALSRLNDYFRFGPNCKHDIIECLSEAASKQIIAFMVPNEALVTVSASLLLSNCETFFNSVDQIYLSGTSDVIINKFIDTLEAVNPADITYPAMDAVISAIVDTLISH